MSGHSQCDAVHDGTRNRVFVPAREPACGPTLAPLCLLSLLIACWVPPDLVRANDTEPRRHPESPWFTGSLLSTRAQTIDPEHWVVQPYFYSTRYGGLYNNNWRAQSASVIRTNIQQTYLRYGVTSRIDVEIAPQWVGNHAQDQSSVGLGDFPVQLGVQVLKGRSESWVPDVRVWVQETFPTGDYTNLSPTTASRAGTGGGSYATILGVGAQKAIWVTGERFLRYRLNATYGFYSPVTVQGFNSYGGGFGTTGRVYPGSVITLAVAGEYTMTRRVALALDISFQMAEATRFAGTAGVDAGGKPATVGRGYNELITVAPAIEYNWNQHVGVIAGPWFSLSGKNTAEFFGVVAALYLYF